jgi:hypothetical protein
MKIAQSKKIRPIGFCVGCVDNLILMSWYARLSSLAEIMFFLLKILIC